MCRELGGLGLGGSGSVHRVSDTAATTAATAATIHQKCAPTNPMSDRMPVNCQKLPHRVKRRTTVRHAALNHGVQ